MSEVETLLCVDAGKVPPGATVFRVRDPEAPTRRLYAMLAISVPGIELQIDLTRRILRVEKNVLDQVIVGACSERVNGVNEIVPLRAPGGRLRVARRRAKGPVGVPGPLSNDRGACWSRA